MADKIKVLVHTLDKAGVAFYRSTKPHIMLGEMYPDEFDITINDKVDWKNDAYLKNFQLIHVHRSIEAEGIDSVELIKKLNKMGIVVVIDIDDYWIIPKQHPVYELVKGNQFSDKIIENLKAASCVTTTTPYFAEKIFRHNDNVFVIPNAIDPEDPQFQNETVQSDKVRISYIGGSSHLWDLNQIRPLFHSLRTNKFGDKKIQLGLHGWDLRGAMTEKMPNGEVKQRPIQPKETSWYYYEMFFTDEYKLIEDKNYYNHLMKFTDEKYFNEDNQPYKRYWTKPVNSYATHYNNCDISLAPLYPNEFNRVKSQLKVIEAGFFKKALIAEKMEPYKIDIINGKNGYLVDSVKNPTDWFKYAKNLIIDENHRKEMGEALYETVKDKYNLKTTTAYRRELYIELVNKMN